MSSFGLPPKRGGRRPYAKVSVLNPGKGLNTLISDNLIDDREASSLDNIQFVESGAPAKAYGFTSVATGTTQLRGLGYYNDQAAGAKYLLTVDNTTLKYKNGSVLTSISGASFDSSANITMTQAAGSMYIWDGVNGGAQLATTLVLTRPGTMPKAKFSIYYGGFHIAAGVAGQDSRLYISESGDASKFTRAATVLNNSTEVPGATVFSGTTANYVDIAKNDGDKITALAKFNEVLIVFKERSIYQITFDSTGTPVLAPVTKNYGCVSHRSVDNVENDVFFLSRNGFYVLGNEPNYFNVIRTNELSARIHPTIETINPANYEKAAGLFYNYVYYCSIPSGGVTANNQVLTYDRRFQAWSKWSHVLAESFCVFLNSSNQEEVYFTGTGDANLYMMSTDYSANGSAIEAQWTSKAFDIGDFNSYKRWIDLTILFRQLVGTVTITVFTDNGTIAKQTSITSSYTGGVGSYMWAEDTFGGEPSTTTVTATSNNIPYRMRLSTKARSIKVKISNDRENETFVVLGMSATYRNYSHFSWPSALKIQG